MHIKPEPIVPDHFERNGFTAPLTARANELLNGRHLVFGLAQGQASQDNMPLFEEFVATAAKFGATHIEVGRLPFRYGTKFLPDNHDPYAAWCNTSFGLLWAFPSEELSEFIPREEVAWAQDYLGRQMEILRRHGLKGVIDSIEPLWLPEEVYRAHPNWRGAQCELGRIARRPYFAPCIDEPEVLELYRGAVRSLCEKFPEIDQLNFMSNDSGAGIDWTPNTYPGMNGHNRGRGRDAGARIAGWLNALQEGAAQAGCTVRVHLFSSGLPREVKSSGRSLLKPGQYLGFLGQENQPWIVANAGLGANLWSFTYPAAGLADPSTFVAGLQKVYSNPGGDAGRAQIGIDETNLPIAKLLLESFLKHPGQGSVHVAQTLLEVAGLICGTADGAEQLVAAWGQVDRAVHAIAQVRQKGFQHVLPFCGVSMRWITRPLVPRPAELSEEESEYFRRCLFNVIDGEERHNLCNVLGKPVFRGEGALWAARWCLHEAISTLRGTQQALIQLAARCPEGESAIRLYSARVGALACLALTAQNVIRYQYALDIAHHPQYGWNVMDYDENILYDQRGLQLRKIAREELDNIEELIGLIQSESEPVIIHARRPDEESVFMLGPDLIGDMRRKMNLMLDRWWEYEELYPATKVWEFEPRTGGADGSRM